MSRETINEFTKEKQREYRKITNRITSDLWAALILHKLKTWNKWQADIYALSYNENWDIIFNKSNSVPKKWAVDIWWNIQDINIIEICNNLFTIIDESEIINDEDKKHLKEGINNFLQKQFRDSRRNLEKKKNLLHKKFRNFYTKCANNQTNLTNKEKILYRDICLTLANMLYSKNSDFLNDNWEIKQKWLDYIWKVFLKTLKHIQTSGSSKWIHKIFHDWDFNFLRKENSKWQPITWTLDHYVQAIMYLMDPQSFNAYNDSGIDWENERYKTKKLFLNNLYTTAYIEDDQKKEAISDKWVIHKELSEIWDECKDSIEDKTNWELTARFKTEASKMLKAWWRTKEIKDESWIRATYYWDKNDESWAISDSITTLCKKFLSKVCETDWITIEKIQSDRKWDFISKENEEEILQELNELITNSQDEPLKEISKRLKDWKKRSILENISSIYIRLTKKKPSDGLQQAYKIANGEIKRWSNWKYEDFKLLVEYSINQDEYNEWIDNNRESIEKDTTLYQEISFYPHSNDLNIWNHNFLDLEKRIFTRVKNMNDAELGKSISLHRLRYFTETALKDISFDIDIYEDKVKRWILPKPLNDDYKYLTIDWNEKIPLDGLIFRNKDNTDRFDKLIIMVLNYFIKSNKIFYINRDWDDYYWLIKQNQLHDKKIYKSRRFTTSDVLRNTALDPKNESYWISFYTEDSNSSHLNFHSINLWDLWDFIWLEKLIQQKAKD